MGALGPIVLLTVPPLREKYGDPNRARIPMTYPSTRRSISKHTQVKILAYSIAVPPGPRKIPEGFDDEE
jgi:hypothetical protein